MLSTAMMTKGVRPVSRTRSMVCRLYPPKVIRSGGTGPNRNRRTNRQLASWLSTVAMAAPRTPRSSRKIKTGSRMMLRTAPSITDCIPFLAKPWQMMNWFMPVDSRANTVPVR